MGELTQWSENHPVWAGVSIVAILLAIWVAISALPDVIRYIRISRM